MTPKVIDISKYNPKRLDRLFFDNNIWMHLFCPLGNYQKKKQAAYSSFLQSAQSAGSAVFVNSLVLSEFANSYLRLDFNLWKGQEGKPDAVYKQDYVGTSRYQETASEVIIIIKKILSISEKMTDNFNAVDLDIVFNHFNQIDFNDSYYLELASISKWKIVTDDKDFSKCGQTEVEIITVVS